MKCQLNLNITSHEKTGGVVTRLQSKNKPLRPLKVAKTKIVNLTSRVQETTRDGQESGQTEKEDRKR